MNTKDKSTVEILIEYRQLTLRKIIEQQREKSRQPVAQTESPQPAPQALKFSIEDFLSRRPRRIKSSKNSPP
ncbi:hypothetical protein RBH38_28230, partial [Escherichia coli]